jgi:aryl-alcohol dehydrogenase-like predicted oxidoreductase
VRKRPLGKTGLMVTEFCVGTWGLSGDGYGLPATGPAAAADLAATARATLECATELGVNFFETSDAYGAGLMETWLGDALPRDAIVATKLGVDRATDPPTRKFDEQYLEAALVRSAKRLRRERVDLALLHSPTEEYLLSHNIGATMAALKSRGLCTHWGVAAGNSAVARLAIRQGAEVVELAYNLVHPTDMHRVSGDALVERVGVLARSPLAYGLLSGQWDIAREFAEGDHRRSRYLGDDLRARVALVEELRFLVSGDVTSLRGAAVRFVLASTVVSSAVLGPRNPEHIRDLVRETGEGPRYLSDDAIRQAFRVIERSGVEL